MHFALTVFPCEYVILNCMTTSRIVSRVITSHLPIVSNSRMYVHPNPTPPKVMLGAI